MDVKKANKNKLAKKCRCCLVKGTFRDMWAEYTMQGERIVYGELINECFELNWPQPEYPEQICMRCINRLYIAHEFKKEFIMSSQLLIAEMTQDVNTIQKEFKIELKVESSGEDEMIDEEGEYLDYNEFEETHSELKAEAASMGSGSQEKEVPTEYLEVEYLEEDDRGMEKLESMEDESKVLDDDGDYEFEVEFVEDTEDTEDSQPTIREPKKKRGKKSYKKYTEEDLSDCIEAVDSGRMSRHKAAKHYKVPEKTLAKKMRERSAKLSQQDESLTDEKAQKQGKLISEVKKILTYTNATPFRSKMRAYMCSYCGGAEGPLFEEPEELRAHTREAHASNRLRGVEKFLRPYWLNETMKIDIHKLQCTVCCTPIPTWNDMFQHLKTDHGVELDEAYTKCIPFILDDEHNCALCGIRLNVHHIVDGHMNSHYSNYICGECGDTFLSESRLKKHVETHSNEKFPCDVCGKVFTLEKYRKRHIHGVHGKGAVMKCRWCDTKFKAEYPRHLHVMQHHREKVKEIKCQLCPKKFSWRPYFLKHMRTTHNKDGKKYECSVCDKTFHTKYELKNHEDWHNDDSSFICKICDKKFTSKPYLTKHLTKIHVENQVIILANPKLAE